MSHAEGEVAVGEAVRVWGPWPLGHLCTFSSILLWPGTAHKIKFINYKYSTEERSRTRNNTLSMTHLWKVTIGLIDTFVTATTGSFLKSMLVPEKRVPSLVVEHKVYHAGENA